MWISLPGCCPNPPFWYFWFISLVLLELSTPQAEVRFLTWMAVHRWLLTAVGIYSPIQVLARGFQFTFLTGGGLRVQELIQTWANHCENCGTPVWVSQILLAIFMKTRRHRWIMTLLFYFYLTPALVCPVGLGEVRYGGKKMKLGVAQCFNTWNLRGKKGRRGKIGD